MREENDKASLDKTQGSKWRGLSIGEMRLDVQVCANRFECHKFGARGKYGMLLKAQ